MLPRILCTLRSYWGNCFLQDINNRTKVRLRIKLKDKQKIRQCYILMSNYMMGPLGTEEWTGYSHEWGYKTTWGGGDITNKWLIELWYNTSYLHTQKIQLLSSPFIQKILSVSCKSVTFWFVQKRIPAQILNRRWDGLDITEYNFPYW